MAQFVSDISFEDGVRGRYIEWSWPNNNVDDFFPAEPINDWNLIKQLQINYSKIGAAEEIFNLDVIRDKFGRIAYKIWGRRWRGANTTADRGEIQANEVQSEATFFMVSTSDLMTGGGILLPPRTQLQSNIEGDSVCTSTMFVLTSPDIKKLLPYM